MAAVRGRGLSEMGQMFSPFTVSGGSTAGQPALLRTWGIPTGPGWYALGPGKWNLSVLPIIVWQLLEWIKLRLGG